MDRLPDGLIVVGKRGCPTCVLIEPVLGQLKAGGTPLTVLCQDDPNFPESVADVVDDTSLELSYHLNVEIVPTLIRIERGREVARLFGWHRGEWEDFTGQTGLGPDLPETRPGCGAINVEPDVAERLAAQFGNLRLAARRIELAPLEDEIEACYDRGWSDGLPVVPPTEVRVRRMLAGTSRAPDAVVGMIPPDLAECTVEKVAINAVLAGCKPEYMPVVLAAVEAALIDAFCMHGLLCTTMFGSPVIIVNGPIARAIGMNAGGNALGQGNRANGSIGRALQLVVRNVGGGRPGGVDRSALGNPGKYTFCFAEDESDETWTSLAVERGFAPGVSTVTLFAGEGVQGVVDQHARTPEALAQTFAACLRTVAHPKLVMMSDAMLVVSPEHVAVFRAAGWSKERLKQELHDLLQIPGALLMPGAGGMTEGMAGDIAGKTLSKFRPDGLNIVRAGGGAGKISAIIGGWAASGVKGSIPVSKEIMS